MKRVIFSLVAILICSNAFNQKLPHPADPKATKETVALFQSLGKLMNKGIMYGHQDDLMYGQTEDSMAQPGM